MFAIIKTGGKQFRVQEGDVVFVEKLNAEPETTVTLDKVLLVSKGDAINVGAPYVDGATVSAKVLVKERLKRL